MAVAGELDRRPKHVLPAFQVALGGLELALCRLLGDADPVLLILQEIERDGVRVERLQQLAPFLGEPGESLRQDDPAL
ncbi:MAG TPA: hypothetical protein VE646_09895 [Actinomycetota bacterium]|nr:hypothetical protein [Actinomycetota bacterium]